MTTFRQVVPNSTVNDSNKKYEYFMVWLSVGGGVRNWLFSHTDGDSEDSFENIVIESLSDIRSVPTNQRRQVETRTTSLDSDTFDYVKSILASDRVYVLSKEGVKTPVAMRGGSVIRANKLKQFEIRIKFDFKENNILNV